MVRSRPFVTPPDVFAKADAAAGALKSDDWLEAFRHHPRIGERIAEREQSDAARAWSGREQAQVQAAGAEAAAAFEQANREYERRFGHVFIVAAAGRSAGDLLGTLRSRLSNDAASELQTAAAEQRKITRQRLEQVLG
jgi:OHCU decarboxylase